MPYRPSRVLVLLLCLSALGTSSCLVRRRIIVRKGGSVRQALLSADKKTLVARIAQVYTSVRDFSATVDMVPALGSTEKSKVTEYKDVRGYILFRKPSDIRLIGLYPVVRNKAFDMVSTGADFKLYVPSRNRFLVGKNELTTPSPNKLENLRPQHFVEAMLVRPVETGETAVLENLTDEDNAYYVLLLLKQGADGQLQLARTVWFERFHLSIARQIVYDAAGNILTDARYTQWQSWDNVGFPKQVEIDRPRDEYAVVITVVKMDINKGIPDDKFVLDQPPGTILQVVGEKPAEVPQPAPPAKGRKRKK